MRNVPGCDVRAKRETGSSPVRSRRRKRGADAGAADVRMIMRIRAEPLERNLREGRQM